MATKENTSVEETLRYGISALSTEYREYAEPDELMVQTVDGKIFYKRADGQIVTEVPRYTKNDLIMDMVRTRAVITIPETYYIGYHILRIAEKNDISDPAKQDVGLSAASFPVNDVENGFFLRVRGNSLMDGAMSFIRAIYETRYPEDSKSTYDISIEVEVTTSGGASVSTIQCGYNELTFVKLDVEEAYSFKILSIQYPKLYNAIQILTPQERDALNSMIMNTKFESAVIDLVRFIDTIQDAPVYMNGGQIVLGYILPYTEFERISQTVYSENIVVVSNEKPDYACLWAKTVE